jgi:hypothetical protein
MAGYQQAKFYLFACEALGGISGSAKQVIIANVTTNSCTWLSRKAVINHKSRRTEKRYLLYTDRVTPLGTGLRCAAQLID